MTVATLNPHIAMKHGAGGRAMRRLIEQVFLRDATPVAAAMDDGAAIPVDGGWLVVTTDSHVIHPVVFPGGDIGRLAVAGTVNDLAMMGATEPLGLTCGVIVEEGFPIEALVRLHESMRATCEEGGTSIVAGDTKVMRARRLERHRHQHYGRWCGAHVVRDSGLRRATGSSLPARSAITGWRSWRRGTSSRSTKPSFGCRPVECAHSRGADRRPAASLR